MAEEEDDHLVFSFNSLFGRLHIIIPRSCKRMGIKSLTVGKNTIDRYFESNQTAY